MAVVRNAEPTTAYEIEMHKWDTPKREGGYGADGYEPFPTMVYKAHRRDNGKVMCLDMDALYAADMNVVARAEAFNNSCMMEVKDQSALERALSNGWRPSPQAALDYQESLARDIAQAAAEANYGVQRMSEKAQREHKALDAATDAPVADVPAPKKAPKATRVAVS